MADNYPKSPSDRPILVPGVQSYGASPYQNYQPQYQLNVPGQLSLSGLVDGSQGYGGQQEQGQLAFGGGGHSHPLTDEERLQAEAEKKKIQSRERVRRFRDRKRKEKEELRAVRAQKAAQQGDLNVRIRRELVKEVVDKFVEVVEGRPPAVAREILQKFLAHPQVKATLRDGAVPPAFLPGRAPDQSVATPKGRKRKQPAQEVAPPPHQVQQLHQQHLHQQLHQPQGGHSHQQGGHSHQHLQGGAYPAAGDSLLLSAGLVNGTSGQPGSVHM
ncbi:hypothetical protein KFL_002660060 [Klebsormidium nitens]|uniref:BZIP domain-containing protein n=1 Tax=Klebsormidium nitens TaxID=105231 RepID=A0A1Y1IBE5_KLENI|nr:hypothetical protein KFL_002660060 [Klebsormidium nitens]|eukprot:GAQ86026.1 hypothetical protein KFL_002660060 [Klebsormidium nitens]